MVTASRNLRRKRRIKRTNSLLKKSLKQSYAAHAQALVTLFAALAQRGGSIMVTEGTLKQASQNVNRLSYQVNKGDNEGEWLVQVVDAEGIPSMTATTHAFSVSPTESVSKPPESGGYDEPTS
mgnify:CR=1 FL=1